MRIGCAIAFIIALGVSPPIGGQPAVDAHTGMVCTRDDYTKADDALDGINSWRTLYHSYKRFRQCDDGALSEGYSDTVAQLMVQHWEHLVEAVEISRTDPAFEDWFVSHLDETDTNDDLVKINQLARTACPAVAKGLCRKIHVQIMTLGCDPSFPEGAGCPRDLLPTNSQQVEETAAYVSYDYSPLLKPKTVFLGFIGSDYQRLKIQFDSVERDASKNSLYNVTGISEAKGTRCRFYGTITVQQITRLVAMHYGVDDEYRAKGIRAEGVLTAHYEFHEYRFQKHSGVFSGVMMLAWYIDREGVLRYDNIRIDSDDYRNNQYEGTWTAYGERSIPKMANWGEYKIPDSGELDRGAGEFGPDRKYPGWENYVPRH